MKTNWNFVLLLIISGCCLCSCVIIRTKNAGGSGSDNLLHWASDPATSSLALKSAKTLPGNGCYCMNYTCACCEHLYIPKIHVNDTGCVEIVYLPEEIGISLLFLIDNVAWINKTVSVHNPPPVCYAVPKVSLANLCIQFYNLDVKEKLVSGCVRAVAEVEGVEIYQKDIGCFRFPIYWHEAARGIQRVVPPRRIQQHRLSLNSSA